MLGPKTSFPILSSTVVAKSSVTWAKGTQDRKHKSCTYAIVLNGNICKSVLRVLPDALHLQNYLKKVKHVPGTRNNKSAQRTS